LDEGEEMQKVIVRILIISFLGAIVTSVVNDILFARMGIHRPGFDYKKMDDMSYREAMDYQREYTHTISGPRAYSYFIKHIPDLSGAGLLFSKVKIIAIYFVSIFLCCFLSWRWNL
jgi:hypothetical protein